VCRYRFRVIATLTPDAGLTAAIRKAQLDAVGYEQDGDDLGEWMANLFR
jgi:hypothetical protein